MKFDKEMRATMKAVVREAIKRNTARSKELRQLTRQVADRRRSEGDPGGKLHIEMVGHYGSRLDLRRQTSELHIWLAFLRGAGLRKTGYALSLESQREIFLDPKRLFRGILIYSTPLFAGIGDGAFNLPWWKASDSPELTELREAFGQWLAEAKEASPFFSKDRVGIETQHAAE